MVTHSLGSVLAREALPRLVNLPVACFFLAPPTKVCLAAERLSQRRWYKLLTGEMGRLLADNVFMSSLPVPEVPTKIYAGNAGLVGKFSPFGSEPNDGVLAVNETELPGISHEVVPSLHTFIMNNAKIADDIIQSVQG